MTLHLAQDYCGRIVPSLNDNRKREIIVILVVMMVASTFAVALRVAARRISAAKYGLDDLFILIALVGQSSGCILICPNRDHALRNKCVQDICLRYECN